MGFFLSMPHSRRAILNILVSALLFNCQLSTVNYQFFIMSDIPGRKPSNFSTGRAFTSKVFRSY